MEASMPCITSTIDVSAPIDAVFSFIADRPDAAPSFIPGLNRIENVTPGQPRVDQSWNYEFNWFGVVFTGRTRCTAFERPSRYQFKTETGHPSTWTYTFSPTPSPQGEGTSIRLEVDFEVPANMLARFAVAGALEKMNQDKADDALRNVKGLVET
jgi:carbon monoxide dehydrogenase subunit G